MGKQSNATYLSVISTIISGVSNMLVTMEHEDNKKKKKNQEYCAYQAQELQAHIIEE